MTSAFDFTSQSRVGVAMGEGRYDAAAPFSPDRRYPEYALFGEADLSPRNGAYALVRQALRLADLDVGRFNTDRWNPFGAFIAPGNTVVLKPNFVREFRESNPDHADCLITHGAILRAAVDYAYIALGGRGRIVIADAPHNDADFAAIRHITFVDEIVAFYRRAAGFEVEVYDLRPACAKKIDGVIVGHEPLAGDPAGYAKVDLGKHSAFMEVKELCHLLYGSEYDMRELHSHQHDDLHEYLISRTVLDADCVISLPKLKTHKKVGLTVNMKNLVGINGNKNWLPHHREGTPSQGGDQFPDDRMIHRIERSAVAKFKRAFPILGPLRPILAGPIKSVGKRVFGDTNTDTIRSGNWHGNDTTWRMVMDLNRILYYADAGGSLHRAPQRRLLSIVDGIVAGEGNGPLDPIPKPTGVVLAGINPVAVDLACARLMGFDYRRMPVLHRAFDASELPLVSFHYDDVMAASNDERFNRRLADFEGRCLEFKPHFGWRGHVEVDDVAVSAR